MGEEEDTLEKSLSKSFGSRGGQSKSTPPVAPEGEREEKNKRKLMKKK
jgi:hypothetical protein